MKTIKILTTLFIIAFLLVWAMSGMGLGFMGYAHEHKYNVLFYSLLCINPIIIGLLIYFGRRNSKKQSSK